MVPMTRDLNGCSVSYSCKFDVIFFGLFFAILYYSVINGCTNTGSNAHGRNEDNEI
jgi:hypothetical protein